MSAPACRCCHVGQPCECCALHRGSAGYVSMQLDGVALRDAPKALDAMHWAARQLDEFAREGLVTLTVADRKQLDVAMGRGAL